MVSPARRTILVAEDDAKTAASLRLYLEHAGHRVVVAEDGEAALAAAARERPDVVLLDWMLPRRDGVEVCRALRALPASRSVPILMLTARGLEQDKLHALYQGADDYVVKPFSPREVVARVHAALRRASGGESGASALEMGGVVLDPPCRTVTVQGTSLPLTGAEFRLLEALLRAPGRVLSRAHLMDKALGAGEARDRTVDVHMARLRRKLGADAGVRIVTVYGAGYRLDVTP
jgi:DNA-binding response OmpR family regulator